MPKEFNISRRKALAALGTIGVASAGAGVGTTAYFNDTESFDDNMMTAGELDLVVNYEANVDQGSEGTFDIDGSNDGGTTGTLSVTDIKPGDSGNAKFCFEIEDNPAYLWACGQLTSSSENGYTEPEPEDDNGEGELEEKMDVDVLYCTPNEEGDGYTTGEKITSGTLRSVLDELDGGIPLDGSGDGSAVAGSQAAYDGTTNESGDADVTNPCVCFEFEVPTSVENIIQGDSVKFDLQFNAQQARHNDGTRNPCLEGRTGTGFAKNRKDFSPTWNARGIIGNNEVSTGGGELSELDIRDANDTELASGEADYENGTSQSFTLDYSSGEASLTVGGDTVSLSSAPAPSDDDAAITVKTSSGNTVEVSNVKVNGASPAGASSVSASGGSNGYLFLAGGGVSDGDTITGEVTFSWSGSEPSGESMGFRVDA